MNSSSSLTEPLIPNDAELGIISDDASAILEPPRWTEQQQTTQSIRRASFGLGVIIGCLTQSTIVVWNVKAMTAMTNFSCAYYLDVLVLLVGLPVIPFLFTFLLCKLIRQGATIVHNVNPKENVEETPGDGCELTVSEKWEEVLTSDISFRFIYGYAFGLLVGHLLFEEPVHQVARET